MSVQNCILRSSRKWSDNKDKVRCAEVVCKWCKNRNKRHFTILCDDCHVRLFIEELKK